MPRNFLVVGSGGREHSLVWKLQKELDGGDKIFVAHGNPGTEWLESVENIPINVDDINNLLNFALDKKMDLTIVGPDNPLANGIVDRFQETGLNIFGPTQRAAEIESSKVFAKQFMHRNNIPTAEPFHIVDNGLDARKYATQIFKQYRGAVIKVDGLALGKGAFVCRSEADIDDAIFRIFGKKEFGRAGDRVVVERLLRGEEASFIVWTDGNYIIPLLTTQDHKPVYDGDKGPNTGGMGAYTRPKIMHGLESIMDDIVRPAVDGLANEKRLYKGVLYAGLMISNGQPYVLEFNARYGDPETQPVMRLLESSLIDISFACVGGTLHSVTPKWSNDEAVCVVLATQGYPGDYQQNTGKPVFISDLPDYAVVFHAGTGYENGGLANTGGRVLGVTASGKDLREALDRAYSFIGTKISFEGMHFRKDIGYRSLHRA